MDEFFPHGVLPYVVGGLLIGVGISLVYGTTGRIAGLSSSFSAIHALWSRRRFFRQDWLRDDLRWKTLLVVGILAGAGAYTWLAAEPYHSTVQPWRLFVGGTIVGIGTRHARGCTSGHGICGIADGARSSLVSTGLFLGVAIVVAHVVASLGVTP